MPSAVVALLCVESVSRHQSRAGFSSRGELPYYFIGSSFPADVERSQATLYTIL